MSVVRSEIHQERNKVLSELVGVVVSACRDEFPEHLTLTAGTTPSELAERSAEKRVSYVAKGMYHAVALLGLFANPDPQPKEFENLTDHYPNSDGKIETGNAIIRCVDLFCERVRKCDNLTVDGERFIFHAKAASDSFREALNLLRKDLYAAIESGEFDKLYWDGFKQAQLAARYLTQDHQAA